MPSPRIGSISASTAIGGNTCPKSTPAETMARKSAPDRRVTQIPSGRPTRMVRPLEISTIRRCCAVSAASVGSASTGDLAPGNSAPSIEATSAWFVTTAMKATQPRTTRGRPEPRCSPSGLPVRQAPSGKRIDASRRLRHLGDGVERRGVTRAPRRRCRQSARQLASAICSSTSVRETSPSRRPVPSVTVTERKPLASMSESASRRLASGLTDACCQSTAVIAAAAPRVSRHAAIEPALPACHRRPTR